jgi:hypothetical protein
MPDNDSTGRTPVIVSPLWNETSACPVVAQLPAADGGSNLLATFYRPIERALEKIKDSRSHLCFIRGAPGIGKSYQIRKGLCHLGLPFVEVNGFTSEAYLYRLLYENKDKVIWFQDVAQLLKGLRSIDVLKSATETTQSRLITNLSYSDKELDLPRQFIFIGSLIFDFNSLAGLRYREDFEALATRGDFIDLAFTRSQRCEILLHACRSERERTLTRFLIEETGHLAIHALNLRTQQRAFQTADYARGRGLDWRTEVREELKQQPSPVQRLLYPLLGDGPVRANDLKTFLVRLGVVSTMRTADRRINDWLEMGEIHRASGDFRNFLVSLVPYDQFSL